MEETRVSLVGGSPLLQAGIIAVLSQDPTLVLIDQLPGDCAEITLVSELSGDVLVLNTDSPRLDVPAIVRQLSPDNLPRNVLVLTDNESIDDMRVALRQGVTGYGIRSALLPDDLLAAVRTVALARTWACPRTMSRLIATTVENDPAASARWTHKTHLSEREQAVLRLAVAGAREAEIATQLVVSPNTVKTYLRRIRQKLNVDSRAQAVHLAVASGLFPPSDRNSGLESGWDPRLVTERVTP